MATMRGNFAQLLAPALMEVFFEKLKEHPEEYSQFLQVDTSESAYEETQEMAGFGLAKKKYEGEPLTYDDPIQGGSKRWIHDAYALGWQVTKEMIDDEKYNIMSKMPGELMKSCRQLWEQIAANVLNLGFTTVTGFDGTAFFNNTHPLLGGGTFSNLLTPAADLSMTALQDIIINFAYMVNNRGLKMKLSPTDIWMPPDLQFTAKKILESNLEPFTGENQTNVLRSALKPHYLHFLTSPRAFHVSTSDSNEAKFFWRVKPVVDSVDDFDTKGTKHSIYFRVSAGVDEWRGWSASNPT